MWGERRGLGRQNERLVPGNRLFDPAQAQMEVGGRADADELGPDVRAEPPAELASVRDMREARGFVAAPRLEPCELDRPGQLEALESLFCSDRRGLRERRIRGVPLVESALQHPPPHSGPAGRAP